MTERFGQDESVGEVNHSPREDRSAELGIGDGANRRRRLSHLAVVAIGVGLLAMFASADMGSRLWSWNQLLERTAYIDNADLWQPYMEVSYCEFSEAASFESSDELFFWTFDAHRETSILRTRLSQRVARIEGLFIAPWHTQLRQARAAILDHYEVWLDSLEAEERFLAAPGDADQIYDGYLAVVVPYDSDIAATFEAARDAYYLAQPLWLNDSQQIEAVFLDEGEVPVSCDRGVSA